eukprot:45925_1
MISLIGDKSLYMVSIIINDTLDEAHSHLIYEISDYVYFFVGPTLVLCMGLVVWMLYYDITFAQIILSNKWTHFIDPEYNNKPTEFQFANDWFIKHKTTFGNTGWLSKYIITPICILIYTSLFLSLLVHSGLHYFIFLAWMAANAIFVAVTYWYIPKAQIEVFKITQQTDRMIQLSMSFVVFFGIYILLRLFIVAPEYQFAMILPFQYIFALHYFVGGLITTRYVLTRCGLINTNKPLDLERVNSLKTFVGSALKLAKLDSMSEKKETYLPLTRILSDKICWNAFMSHLLKEFSSENLLCILECWQFKTMINDFNHNKIQRASSNVFETDKTSEYVGGNELKVNEALIDYSLPLDDEMPQSVIVYNDDLRIEDKALMLIEKYIYSATGNCLFEVNISSSCKYKIMQKSQELHEIVFTLQ